MNWRVLLFDIVQLRFFSVQYLISVSEISLSSTGGFFALDGGIGSGATVAGCGVDGIGCGVAGAVGNCSGVSTTRGLAVGVGVTVLTGDDSNISGLTESSPGPRLRGGRSSAEGICSDNDGRFCILFRSRCQLWTRSSIVVVSSLITTLLGFFSSDGCDSAGWGLPPASA